MTKEIKFRTDGKKCGGAIKSSIKEITGGDSVMGRKRSPRSDGILDRWIKTREALIKSISKIEGHGSKRNPLHSDDPDR